MLGKRCAGYTDFISGQSDRVNWGIFFEW